MPSGTATAGWRWLIAGLALAILTAACGSNPAPAPGPAGSQPVAGTSRLRSDPGYAGAVRRFVAAFLAGTGAAMKNPGAATTVMRDVSQYSTAFLQASVPYTLKLLGQRGGLPMGCLDLAAFGNWLKAHQLVHDTPDAAAIMTDRYLPQLSCPGQGAA